MKICLFRVEDLELFNTKWLIMYCGLFKHVTNTTKELPDDIVFDEEHATCNKCKKAYQQAFLDSL